MRSNEISIIPAISRVLDELTVAEAEAGDEVVLVERRQRLADDADGLLVGVWRVPQPVQALPAERLLP